MRATTLLVENIGALLRARGIPQKDLAFWCKKTETWVSQALNRHRNIQLEDLDRIAEFFGLAAYQLFQPGITPYTERRSGKERRTGIDRRLSHLDRLRSVNRDFTAGPPARDREPLEAAAALVRQAATQDARSRAKPTVGRSRRAR